MLYLLFTDKIKNKNSVDVNKYDKIYVINKDSKKLDNFISIDYYQYFIEAHKLTRELNKKILSKLDVSNNYLLASLFKSSDLELFTVVRMLLIVIDNSSIEDEIVIDIENGNLVEPICLLLNLNLNLIVKKKKKYFISYIKNVKFLLVVPLLLLNNLFVKKKYESNIFFLWNDPVSYKFVKPYLNDSLITFPYFNKNIYMRKTNYKNSKHIKFKFIVLKEFFSFIKRYKNNCKDIQNFNLDENIKKLFINKLLQIELSSAIILSLCTKFPNLKNIIGLFDAYSHIDYITYNLNKIYNVKTICIPHGINFKYKVNYISYGVNQYTFWSNNHLDTFKNFIIFNHEKTNLKVTGNIVYNEIVKSKCNSVSNIKNILVVGEYFSNDDYYSSAFNKKVSKKFFDILENFVKHHSDVTVTIRARLNDGYNNLASKYKSERFQITDSNKDLVEQICNHDLIISVFSNVLHEALLLEKKVLQVNLLEIENYRNLANENLLYYADTEEKFKNYLIKWYENQLKKLDYKKHLSNYTYNGKFQPLRFKF